LDSSDIEKLKAQSQPLGGSQKSNSKQADENSFLQARSIIGTRWMAPICGSSLTSAIFMIKALENFLSKISYFIPDYPKSVCGGQTD
jgi:hypothetical protein